MTRGEAPGGSRPGAFGAIRLRRMDGGSLQPLLAGALTPIRTASPAARNRSRWATASAIHGAGWRLSTGERRRKLRLSYFS